MIKLKKILVSILFIIIPAVIFSQTEKPIAKKGVLDLRDYNFDENIKLNGEWELYWNQLLDHYDFENKIYSPDAYINVKNSWSSYSINGKQLSDTGFATSRLIIFVTPDRHNYYMIHFGEILSSYKVWINNLVLAEVGKVGKNQKQAIPAIEPLFKTIKFEKEKIEIIVQVSNYQHRVAGFFDVPSLGKQENIMHESSKSFFIDIFLFGALLIMALYHFGLFLFRTKNKAPLAFSILSFFSSIRIFVFSHYPLNYIYPNFLSWQMVYIINYITTFVMVASFLYFFQTTFKENRYKLFFKLSYIVTALFSLTLFFPSLIYTKLLIFFQALMLVMILFSSFLLIKYIKAKKTGAIVFAISIGIFYMTTVNDLLYFNDIIRTTPLAHVGIFILILGQSLTLSRIFTDSLIKTEKLTAELDYKNQHLSELVEERTKKINTQKHNIMQQNEELLQQKEELNTQKEAILKQNEIVKAHNRKITDSVNYASTIQQAVLPTSQSIKKYLNCFIIYKPKDIVSGDFYWFNSSRAQDMFMIIGDCTGHGVPGSFISLIAMYMLNSIIIEKQIENPKQVLVELNEMFIEFLNKRNNSNIDGMEICVMKFNKRDTNKLTFAATKTSLFIYDADTNKIERYKGTRRSIGYKKNLRNSIEFENIDIILKSNQIIYYTTDGFIDQNNSTRKRFGTQRFIEMLLKYARMPLQQQKVSFLKEFEDYKKVEKQRDDITFMGISLINNTPLN